MSRAQGAVARAALEAAATGEGRMELGVLGFDPFYYLIRSVTSALLI